MPTRQRIQDRPELVRDALVTLTPAELKISSFIGNSRNKQNRSLGVFDVCLIVTGKLVHL